MKDMLVSLRSSIHSDVQSIALKLNTEIQDLGNRVSHAENKMGEFASAYNDLVDSHNDRENDTVWLKAKVADLRGPLMKKQHQTSRHP